MMVYSKGDVSQNFLGRCLRKGAQGWSKGGHARMCLLYIKSEDSSAVYVPQEAREHSSLKKQ